MNLADFSEPRAKKCGVCRLAPELLAQIHSDRDQPDHLRHSYRQIVVWLKGEGEERVSPYQLRDHFFYGHHR